MAAFKSEALAVKNIQSQQKARVFSGQETVREQEGSLK